MRERKGILQNGELHTHKNFVFPEYNGADPVLSLPLLTVFHC